MPDIAGTPYESPYRLDVKQDVLTDDTFMLPVCTTIPRLLEMHMVLTYGATAIGCPRIGDHNIDFYNALAHINSPETSACHSGTLGGDQGDVGGVGNFEDLIDLLARCNVKFRLGGKLYVPVIDLVEDCCQGGAGDGGSGGDGDSGDDLPGGTPGGDWDNIVSLCDFSTSVVPEILDRVDGVMDKLATGTFFTEIIEVTPGVGALIDSVGDFVTEVQLTLIDSDFIRRARRQAIKFFDDPPQEITRELLRKYARQIPIVFAGAPMQAAFMLWAEVANVAELNWFVSQQSGTGDYAGMCAEIFGDVGRPIYNPRDYDIPLPEIVSDGLRFKQVLGESSFVGGVKWTSSEITTDENLLGIVVCWQSTFADNQPGFNQAWRIVHTTSEIAASAVYASSCPDCGGEYATLYWATQTIAASINGNAENPTCWQSDGVSNDWGLKETDGSPMSSPKAESFTYYIENDTPPASGKVAAVWEVYLADGS
jgi:hypothetical protein